MSKLPPSGAFYADTLTTGKRPAKSITSADSGENATTPQSLVYAQNIIAVTRASMGLATKDLRSTTASVSMSCST